MSNADVLVTTRSSIRQKCCPLTKIAKVETPGNYLAGSSGALKPRMSLAHQCGNRVMGSIDPVRTTSQNLGKAILRSAGRGCLAMASRPLCDGVRTKCWRGDKRFTPSERCSEFLANCSLRIASDGLFAVLAWYHRST
jgi:hypothetical protein